MTAHQAKWSYQFHGDYPVTWDAEANAGYAHTHPNPDAGRVKHTVTIRPDIEVDVDAEGLILGVEVIGHEVGMSDLLTVLRLCHLSSTEDRP